MSELRVGSTSTLSGIDSYRYVDTLYFTSSGTFVKADYPWLRALKVTVVGGGGSGAAASATSAGQTSSGGGGGSGGYAEAFVLESSLSASETVICGAGASGGSGGNGSTGGSSSFGSLVAADGGQGGLFIGASSTTGVVRRGGLGGDATVGDFTVRGTPGEMTLTVALKTQVAPGNGGSSVYGGGGLADARNISSDGQNGDSPGGGGAGAGSVQSNATARTGGDGGNGIVIVELYA